MADAAEEHASGPATAASAAAIALGLAAQDERAGAQAEVFLREQTELARLQMEEMRARNPYELSHFRLRRFSGWAKAVFECSVGLLALALVCGLCVMVWNAARSDGNVIEKFSVPSDLEARGMTGEVVAARLLDRLQVVQTPPSNSVSAAQAVSTGSSDNVKVEIPETGISLGELYRFLRRWLGHETYVSGEVVRQDKDVMVAVRINGAHGAVFQGPETDLDALLQKAAEHVFATVQPVRYGTWLQSQIPQRDAEARALYQRLAGDAGAKPFDQAGGWNGLALLSSRTGDFRQGLSLLRRAQQADPTSALGFTNAIVDEVQLSHPEAALAQLPQAQAVFEKYHDYFSQGAATAMRGELLALDAGLRGDYAHAVAARDAAMAIVGGERGYLILLGMALDRAQLHDGGVVAWLAQQPRPASSNFNRIGQLARPVRIEAALRHWPRAIVMTAEAEQAYDLLPRTSRAGREYFFTAVLHPWLALAKAKTGDIAAAERLIAPAPADCYDCVRIRGMIATQARQWSRADYWFARAVAGNPSVPMAYEDWGRSLLERRLPDAALEKFKLANRCGPHFADALQGWGEALMAKNQSHLALEKFAKAEKYAPNWGRLHLKWGEALAYAGKADEAKAQFARAAALDLTSSEKSELARHP